MTVLLFNCWQDEEIQRAIIDTGRKKILIVGLWTEAYMTFPTLDMLEEGFEVYPVVDATGGARKISNDTALERVQQAGVKLVTLPGILCEIQRDWADTKTVPDFVRLMKEYGAYLQV